MTEEEKIKCSDCGKVCEESEIEECIKCREDFCDDCLNEDGYCSDCE
ncbi:MAG: hypothetical protein I3273_05015 [Candidatus Moeniiplasma glomeromycotorum]|nr:hypothetical protein [Candidatus Moeniiplasma glomeromycotorum]MCE8167903.1 hypothetical protein [Candidatus Moeniiplasma glomeromycotorum]MCE8169453.1 hypothetical protein [Candidatus Moeniiplasma glomeromycotorum]